MTARSGGTQRIPCTRPRSDRSSSCLQVSQSILRCTITSSLTSSTPSPTFHPPREDDDLRFGTILPRLTAIMKTRYCTKTYKPDVKFVHFALMIHAGPTGSRIHIYKFNNCGPSPIYTSMRCSTRRSPGCPTTNTIHRPQLNIWASCWTSRSRSSQRACTAAHPLPSTRLLAGYGSQARKRARTFSLRYERGCATSTHSVCMARTWSRS